MSLLAKHENRSNALCTKTTRFYIVTKQSDIVLGVCACREVWRKPLCKYP